MSPRPEAYSPRRVANRYSRVFVSVMGGGGVGMLLTGLLWHRRRC